MRSIRVTLPDSEYSFFMEFIKHIPGAKAEIITKNEFLIPAHHKKIVNERLKEMKKYPGNFVEWSVVKKRLETKKTK